MATDCPKPILYNCLCTIFYLDSFVNEIERRFTEPPVKKKKNLYGKTADSGSRGRALSRNPLGFTFNKF